MKRLQIHIEESLDDALAVVAAQQKTSKAALIRQAIAEHYAPSPSATDSLMRMAATLDGSSDDCSSIDDVVYSRP